MTHRSLLPLLLSLAGCPTSTTDTPDDFSTCDGDAGADFTIADVDTGGSAVSVDGDTLFVDVAYGGGCEEHTFAICWPDGAFMESDPVQVNLEIFHGGAPDPCEAWVQETRSFDLAPLKDAWHASYGAGDGTITIHLAGAPESVTYTFE